MARPKGAQNKITRDMKEAILEAFEKAGGVDYLVQHAKFNPASFVKLLGRIVPAEVRAEIAAAGPLTINVVTGLKSKPPT